MQNKVIIVTGEVGSGKTGFTRRLIRAIMESGIPVCGFIAEGFWKNGQRERYELADLNTNRRMVYCRKDFKEGWEKTGHFYVNPEAVHFGEESLNPGSIPPEAMVVIDEIGPFELSGNGWTRAIEKLKAHQKDQLMIWVVRRGLLEKVTDYFQIKVLRVIESVSPDFEGVLRELIRLYGKRI